MREPLREFLAEVEARVPLEDLLEHGPGSDRELAAFVLGLGVDALPMLVAPLGQDHDRLHAVGLIVGAAELSQRSEERHAAAFGPPLPAPPARWPPSRLEELQPVLVERAHERREVPLHPKDFLYPQPNEGERERDLVAFLGAIDTHENNLFFSLRSSISARKRAVRASKAG